MQPCKQTNSNENIILTVDGVIKSIFVREIIGGSITKIQQPLLPRVYDAKWRKIILHHNVLTKVLWGGLITELNLIEIMVRP